jgi:hypothetical protein
MQNAQTTRHAENREREGGDQRDTEGRHSLHAAAAVCLSASVAATVTVQTRNLTAAERELAEQNARPVSWKDDNICKLYLW